MSDTHRRKSGKFRDRVPMVEKTRRQQIDVGNFTNRLVIIWLVLAIATLGAIVRLIWLQIIDAPNLQQRAQLQQSTVVRPFIPRRTIVDRQNNQIAIDRPSYTVYAHPIQFRRYETPKGSKKAKPKLVPVPRAEMAQLLAQILASESPAATILERDKLLDKLKQNTGVLLGEGLSEDIIDRLHALKVDGLDISPEKRDYTRFYPQQDMAAEVLGYLDSNRIAQAGVERSQSQLLKRKVTKHTLTKTGGRKGTILPDLVTPDILHTDDLKLKLTVDIRLQRAARKALRETMQNWKAVRGTAIVMEADTGAIRALVVEPTYNPNHYAKDVQEYSKLVGDKAAPSLLRNWAVSDLYEPGSTFKPINVAIALETGIIKPDSKFHDNGLIQIGKYPISNAQNKVNGTINVTEILQHSSNVGMVKMMQKLKPNVYYQWLQRIGLGQKSGIDLPLEQIVPMRSAQEFTSTPIYPATFAFGQGVSIAPIQLVTLISSLANGGKLVTPHVVDGLFDSAGVRKDKPLLPDTSQIFSPATAQTVLEMMETVVTKGSGVNAQIPGYRIAGKTGTSQKAKKGGYSDKKITSFVGILPVDGERRYVVFAAVDEPKDKGAEKALGGSVAAPIVRSVMRSLISIEGIPPTTPIAPSTPPVTTNPNP